MAPAIATDAGSVWIRAYRSEPVASLPLAAGAPPPWGAKSPLRRPRRPRKPRKPPLRLRRRCVAGSTQQRFVAELRWWEVLPRASPLTPRLRAGCARKAVGGWCQGHERRRGGCGESSGARRRRCREAGTGGGRGRRRAGGQAKIGRRGAAQVQGVQEAVRPAQGVPVLSEGARTAHRAALVQRCFFAASALRDAPPGVPSTCVLCTPRRAPLSLVASRCARACPAPAFDTRSRRHQVAQRYHQAQQRGPRGSENAEAPIEEHHVRAKRLPSSTPVVSALPRLAAQHVRSGAPCCWFCPRRRTWR